MGMDLPHTLFLHDNKESGGDVVDDEAVRKNLEALEARKRRDGWEGASLENILSNNYRPSDEGRA